MNDTPFDEKDTSAGQPPEAERAQWLAREQTTHAMAEDGAVERRQTEEALRRSEERFSRIFHASPIAISISTLADGRFLDVNEAFLQLFGYRREEVIGHTSSELRMWADPGESAQIAQQLPRLTSLYNIEVQLRTQSGEMRDGVLAIRLINLHGEICMLVLFQDVTERKRAEIELRKRAHQQAAIAQLSQAALAGSALDWLLHECAALVAQTLGVEFGQVLELMPGSTTFLLRAGIGWHKGFVGRVTVTAGPESPAGLAMRSNEPVVVADFEADARFVRSVLLRTHGVVSGVHVVIPGREQPYGVLGAHSARQHAFDDDDVRFLAAMANVLATAIDRRRAEAQLMESEARLAEAQQIAHVGSWEQDMPAGRMIWSDELFRIFGFAPGGLELTRATFREHVHPEDQSLVARVVDQATLAGGPYTLFFRIERADGTPRTVHMRGNVVLDAEGQPVRVFGTVQDVTEQKQTEEAIRFQAHLLDAVGQAVMATGLDGTVVYWNQAAERLLGWAAGEALGHKSRELTGSGATPEQVAEIRARLASGESWLGEVIVERRDATRLPVMMTSTPLQDETGELIGIISTAVDISERQRVEQIQAALYRIAEVTLAAEDLPELYALIHRIVDELMDARNFYIALYDPEANELSFPYFVDEYDEPPPPRAIGQGLTDFVVRTGKPQLASFETVDEMERQGKIRRQGLPAHYWLGVPLQRGQQTFGVLVVQSYDAHIRFGERERDVLVFVSQQIASAILRKQAQTALERERASLARRVAERTAELSAANAELARAARLKDEFLANMSHELRTPLNAILGLAEAMQEGIYGPLSERYLKSLKTIEESGRHLLALINDILDLSKIGAGKVRLELADVPVERVCRASLQLVKEAAYKKQLHVSLSLEEAAQTQPVRADERRLKQMLVNLLSNAIKFTPEGGALGLEVRGDAQAQAARFTVWDTGIGIAEEDLGRLFQPFVQLDSSLTRQYEGTGLGLSLVYRMAELHGGSVTVESVPGQGSRFTIALPWAFPDQEAPSLGLSGAALNAQRTDGDQAALAPEPVAPPRPALVLLAEDHEENIAMFREYLQAKGFRLAVARNGEEALEQAREQRPDVILMDVQMPRMDGLQVMRRMRADAHLQSVPIIALTALAMPGDRERCLAAGASEYLSKPVSLQVLLQAIQHLLGSA